MEKITLGPLDLNKAKSLTEYINANGISFEAVLQNPSDLIAFGEVFRAEINTPEINIRISKDDFLKHEIFFTQQGFKLADLKMQPAELIHSINKKPSVPEIKDSIEVVLENFVDLTSIVFIPTLVLAKITETFWTDILFKAAFALLILGVVSSKVYRYFFRKKNWYRKK